MIYVFLNKFHKILSTEKKKLYLCALKINLIINH